MALRPCTLYDADSIEAKETPLANRKDAANSRADAAFMTPQQRDDAIKKEIEKEREAVAAKSARLKALRLAKEAADREAAPPTPPASEKKKRAPRKKAAL
jgi:hypothetical protein